MTYTVSYSVISVTRLELVVTREKKFWDLPPHRSKDTLWNRAKYTANQDQEDTWLRLPTNIIMYESNAIEPHTDSPVCYQNIYGGSAGSSGSFVYPSTDLGK